MGEPHARAMAGECTECCSADRGHEVRNGNFPPLRVLEPGIEV